MKTSSAWTAPLRDWPQRALSAVQIHDRENFLAMATPAAGKTCFAIRVSHDFLTKRAAVRMLVVCPINHLKAQWSAAAGTFGLQLDPAFRNEQICEAADYHGAVVTYQQVSLAPAIFQRACKAKKTLVISDELHHAGDGKKLGEGVTHCLPVSRVQIDSFWHTLSIRQQSDPVHSIRAGIEPRRFLIWVYGGDSDAVCRPILFPR